MTTASVILKSGESVSPTLRASDGDLVAGLSSLRDRDDTAALLEIPPSFLRSVLYGVEERKRYRLFHIPKRNGGHRVIESPPTNLRILQRKVLYILSLVYTPRACVHGFARKRSVRTNAASHVRRRWVLNVDLTDFFHHVKLWRIVGALSAAPFSLSRKPATVLAQIACLPDGRLPQGSPCSPILANIVAYGLDTAFLDLAREHHCRYSRYADDITLSTTKSRFPESLARIEHGNTIIGDTLNEAVIAAGFTVNDKKIRLQNSYHRQDVTGLTVNEFPNVRRKYIREIRGMLNAWRSHGYAAAEDELRRRLDQGDNAEVSLRHHLRGKLAYLQMIRGRDDPVVRKLLKQALGVSPEIVPVLAEIASLPSSPLRGHRSPSLAWENIFRRLQSSVYFLEVTLASGDLAGGTGFKISDDILATAGHNLDHGNVEAGLTETIPLRKLKYTNISHGRDIGLLQRTDGYNLAGLAFVSQCRLPELGEQVAAIGFPKQGLRRPGISLNIGVVESLPVSFDRKQRFIQVSFQGGGGLSGGPLIDRGGFVIGIVVESTECKSNEDEERTRKFVQAVPFEYMYDFIHES